MAERNLFTSLQRLFSTDILVRNVGGDELKIADVNHIQSTGKYQTNSLLDRFSRLYIYNNKNIFNPNLNYQTLRIQLYSDYEAICIPKGKVKATIYHGEDTEFVAKWGRLMSLKTGDYIVSPCPKLNEVYRIARKEFLETYEEDL